MAETIVKKVKIQVNDDGTLKRTSKDSQTLNRNMKGLSKQSSNASKNFSKTAQGMQGVLVPAYAEVAARVFALSAAYMALSKVSNYSILIQGQEAYAKMTGKNMARIAKSVQVASKHMLDFKDASTSVALATTSGISSQQIVKMTEAAVDSSSALGRSVQDTMDRLTRGIVKAEPEILDEIGVIIRLDRVYKDYAESVSKSTAELTEAEKASARYTAIMGQLESKFGGIADNIDPNYFAAMAATVMDIIYLFSTKLLPALSGPLKFLTESKAVLIAIMALIAKSLIGKIFPAFTTFGQKITDMPDKMQKRVDGLKKGISNLKTEIKGSRVELEQFNKMTKGGRMTKGMQQARSAGDIEKYARLESAAIKRAQKSLTPGGTVKGGIYQGMNAQALKTLEQQVIKLGETSTRFNTKRQIEMKKHGLSLKGLQLGYANLKLKIAKFGQQQVELMNMGFLQGIKQIGTNFKLAAKESWVATRVIKAGISGVTVAVTALGRAFNAAFKYFMWLTMAGAVVKSIASVWYDFDTKFRQAAQAASELGDSLRKVLEDLEDKPFTINFDGIAKNFADALKNAEFAANLADEIYAATHKAMKALGKELSDMNWFDQLLDKIKGMMKMDDFSKALRSALDDAVSIQQLAGGTLPQGLQDKVGTAQGGVDVKIADIQKRIALEEANKKSKIPAIVNAAINEISLLEGSLLILRAERAAVLGDVLKDATDPEMIKWLKEFDAIHEETAKSTREHATNVKELGQAYSKVGKYQKAYALSIVSKTEYYDIAQAQQSLQNLLDKTSISPSDKILGGIAGGYINPTETLKELQKTIKEEEDKLGIMQRGEGRDYSKQEKKKQEEDILAITKKITEETERMYKSSDAAFYLGVDWIERQERALKAATDRLGIEYKLKKLKIFGNSALEKQVGYQTQILNQEIKLIEDKISTGEYDEAALANAQEILRIKKLEVEDLNSIALQQAEERAKIEGRTLTIVERIAAIKKDEGDSTDLRNYQVDLVDTFYYKMLAGIDKTIARQKKLNEYTANYLLMSTGQKGDLQSALGGALKSSSFAGSAHAYELLQSSVAKEIGESRYKQGRTQDLISANPVLKQHKPVIDLYFKIEKLRAENLSKEAYNLAERHLIQTEYVKAEQDLLDAKWKERADTFGAAMKTIADGFGSAISSHLNDVFMNKKTEKGAFRNAMAQAFASAGSNLIGGAIQKQVFGNKGLVAGMMRGMGMGDKWIDTLFPKTEYELAEERRDLLREIRDDLRKVLGFGTYSQRGGYAGSSQQNYSIWDLVSQASGTGDAKPFNMTGDANPLASQLITTVKGNQIPGWSSFGGQNQSYGGKTSKWYDSGLEELNLNLAPLRAIEQNTGENGALSDIMENIPENLFDLNIMKSDKGIDAILNSILSGGSASSGGNSSMWGTIARAAIQFFAGSGGIAPGGFRAFANGGIANRPTLGMVGEGGMNEAVVPLPDGRSIPVKGAGTNNVTVNVSVDAQGQSSATEVSGDGARELGYMVSQAVQSELVEQQRPGGLLSAYG